MCHLERIYIKKSRRYLIPANCVLTNFEWRNSGIEREGGGGGGGGGGMAALICSCAPKYTGESVDQANSW